MMKFINNLKIKLINLHSFLGSISRVTTLIAYLLIVLSVTRRSRTEWHCDHTSAKITVKKIYDLKAIFFDNLFVIVVTNGFIYYILC